MVPVKLDFHADAADSSHLSKTLAAIGAFALLAVVVLFAMLAKQQHDLRGDLYAQKAELRRQQAAGVAAAAVDPDGEIVRALQRPWQKLLLALESASDPRIAVLEIRPDPGRRLVRVIGEAGNLDETLDYLRRLQQLPDLSRAHLVSYAMMPPTSGNPGLRFIIQADWVTE